MNGNKPDGTASPLSADWQIAQARDLLIKRGYAVIPNGGARLYEMKDQFDPGADPDADSEWRKKRHQAAVLAMAHRLGVALVNNGQVEFVITPGAKGLPDQYALRIVVVSPQAAAPLVGVGAPK